MKTKKHIFLGLCISLSSIAFSQSSSNDLASVEKIAISKTSFEDSLKKKTPNEEILFILEDAKNEFSSILGPLSYHDTISNKKIFDSNILWENAGSGCSESTENGMSRKILVYFFDCMNMDALISSASYLVPLLEIMNARVKSGMYKTQDFKNYDSEDVTRYTDLQDNYIMDIVNKSKSSFGVKIMFYSKNWDQK